MVSRPCKKSPKAGNDQRWSAAVTDDGMAWRFDVKEKPSKSKEAQEDEAGSIFWECLCGLGLYIKKIQQILQSTALGKPAETRSLTAERVATLLAQLKEKQELRSIQTKYLPCKVQRQPMQLYSASGFSWQAELQELQCTAPEAGVSPEIPPILDHKIKINQIWLPYVTLMLLCFWVLHCNHCTKPACSAEKPGDVGDGSQCDPHWARSTAWDSRFPASPCLNAGFVTTLLPSNS